jgi:threonine/homoserine/homoserine lactone efflux protein
LLGTHDLEIFIISCITLNLIPGVDTIYIISRSVSEGMKAGIISALGISTGAIFHILATALGLSALIFSFSYAFTIIKVIGAVYLIYLGISVFLKHKNSLHVKRFKNKEESGYKIYKQAVLTNVLNPKVALFFMALLPQFVAVDAENKMFSFLFLGSIFLCTSTIWCLIIAIFASKVGMKFQSSEKSSHIISKLTGVVFIFLGLKLFLAKN